MKKLPRHNRYEYLPLSPKTGKPVTEAYAARYAEKYPRRKPLKHKHFIVSKITGNIITPDLFNKNRDIQGQLESAPKYFKTAKGGYKKYKRTVEGQEKKLEALAELNERMLPQENYVRWMVWYAEHEDEAEQILGKKFKNLADYVKSDDLIRRVEGLKDFKTADKLRKIKSAREKKQYARKSNRKNAFPKVLARRQKKSSGKSKKRKNH